MERVGTSSRFLFSVEGPQLLRIGNRVGTVLPAHTSSGGRAALALHSESAVAQLYQGRATQRAGGTLGAQELTRLQGELVRVPERGYALDIGLIEPDLFAIGAAVGQLNRPRLLALSLSAPISLAEALQRPAAIASLLEACLSIRGELNGE